MRARKITMMALGMGAALAAACANGGAVDTTNDDDTTSAAGGGEAMGGSDAGGASTHATAGGAGGMAASGATASSSATGNGSAKPPGCGNGELGEAEACDGQLFGDKDCTHFGLAGGYLQCNEYCAVVLTACTPPESCNNLFDDDNDGKTDCEDSECSMTPACTDSCGQASPVLLPAFEFGSTLGAPVALSPGCASSSGSERVYSFTAAKDANYSVDLMSYFYPMVLAVRTNCSDGQTENGCSSLAAFEQKLIVQGVKGTTYYVIVDAVDGKPDDFQITISETN
jgi:hypothetical protein